VLHLTAVVRKEKPMFVSWCPELDVASQGRTIESALTNLREAVKLYLENTDAWIPDDLQERNLAESPVLTCINVKAKVG
jgi:predicted RNase H-like HicB family nuclease